MITGGGTGIGRGLAEAFHKLGNQVTICGRRREVLKETVAANPGMRHLTLDVESTVDIKRFASEVERQLPALDVLINNAGIMKSEDLVAGKRNLAAAEQTVTVNMQGTLRVTAALMPLLLRQAKATIMTLSSGLAFLPIHTNPSYCASKAFVYSWTQSLRYQLRDKNVEVLEIAPFRCADCVRVQLRLPFRRTKQVGPRPDSEGAHDRGPAHGE